MCGDFLQPANAENYLPRNKIRHQNTVDTIRENQAVQSFTLQLMYLYKNEVNLNYFCDYPHFRGL